MKKNLILLTLFLFCAFSNVSFAQSNDPLNQNSTKVSGNWSTESEEVISKKKKSSNNNTTTIVNDKENTSKDIEIVNSCPDNISVELVSLAGNRASQTVTITIKYINHGVNATMRIKDFLAYNEEGDEFSAYNPGSNDSFTDVPIKASWKVGQMLPSKNSKLAALSFRINDCTIEMRNVPIDWR